MKVLVIPDVHLKPWMFDRVAEIMRGGGADRAVCLMDIADDWDHEKDLLLYEESYDRAMAFAKEFPETLWCTGNHDLSYLWRKMESGYSFYAERTAREKFVEFMETLPDGDLIAFVHRIDDVLFSHGGVSDWFVRQHFGSSVCNDVDRVVAGINTLRAPHIWTDASPVWLRPQYGNVRMYKPRKLLQVVGHTPVKKIERKGNVISCDVFSTYPDGTPIGTQEFLIMDTKTWEYKGEK